MINRLKMDLFPSYYHDLFTILLAITSPPSLRPPAIVILWFM